MMSNRAQVYFNEKHIERFEDLKKKGIISREFNEFVRNTFDNAIDEINFRLYTKAETKSK